MENRGTHMDYSTSQPLTQTTFSTPRIIQSLFIISAVTLAYAATGQIGFLFAIKGNVTAIWIPSGIALASVLLMGNRALLGIFLGSFYGNITAFYSPEKAAAAFLVSTIIGL